MELTDMTEDPNVMEEPKYRMDGTELRYLRKMSKLTVADIAKVFFVKPATVQAWESGKWPNGNEAAVPERVRVWFEEPYDADEVRDHASELFVASLLRVGAEIEELSDQTKYVQDKWFDVAQTCLAMLAGRRVPK